MKALTISQPYAGLIADGFKFVENRKWYTPYRGPLAIHAGKGTQYLTRKELRAYDTGCIVATAELIECIDLKSILAFARANPDWHPNDVPYTWQQIAEHEHAEGPFCLILGNVAKLREPIPAKGALGFWEFAMPAGVRVC